jgi:hypothetical protein
MDKKFLFIIFLAILFIGGLYYWGVKHSPKINTVSNEDIERKIELLEKKIDSLSLVRDSIRSVIDTTKVKIIEIHEEYNKVRTNIIYQPVDSDYSQFTKYCADHEGLLNPNNTSAAENNEPDIQRK